MSAHHLQLDVHFHHQLTWAIVQISRPRVALGQVTALVCLQDATRNEDAASKDRRATKNKLFLKLYVDNTSESSLELRAEAKLLMNLYLAPPPVVSKTRLPLLPRFNLSYSMFQVSCWLLWVKFYASKCFQLIKFVRNPTSMSILISGVKGFDVWV